LKSPPIKYTDGWKYVLAEDYLISTGIYPPVPIHHKGDFILSTTGDLFIFKGYPWDGATGAFDTKNSMVASLVHDCFCEMTRLKSLDYDAYSDQIHELLGEIAKRDGMFSFRADMWTLATKTFQGGHPSHPDPHPVMEAP